MIFISYYCERKTKIAMIQISNILSCKKLVNCHLAKEGELIQTRFTRTSIITLEGPEHLRYDVNVWYIPLIFNSVLLVCVKNKIERIGIEAQAMTIKTENTLLTSIRFSG